MSKRKKTKKHVNLHPVMIYIILIIGVIVFSGLLSLFNVSATYNILNAAKMDYLSKTESILSLLNLRGVKYVFSNTVANFANYAVLSHLIIVLLGIGVMEYSGFLKTAVELLTKKLNKMWMTFILVLFGVLASIMDNLPFISLIPLYALIYKNGKRNPNLGIITAFASMTCGYGLSILMTSVDSSLAELTTLSASVLDANFTFKPFSMIVIMLVAIIIVSIAITLVTENVIARKLPKYTFEEDDEDNKELSNRQIRGLLFAGFGSAIYILIFIYNIIPGLPFSGNFLNYSESFYIDKLFGLNSFFANGFVFIITILFIILGLLYGIGAKTINNNNEFIDSLGHSLNGIGNVLVMIFVSATFISIFKHCNLGNVIVAWLSNVISNSNFSGLPLIILLFICSAVATIFVPTSLAKWTIMSSEVVPTFINVGISGVFAQVVFRFGECISLGLTPIFAYYIVYLAYLNRYSQSEKKVGLLDSFKYQIPYSIWVGVILLVLIILWYIVSLPLGLGGFVAV